jgi:hypothetical protein
MTAMDDSLAARLGFRKEGGGAHASRTIMLAELSELLISVAESGAPKDFYRRAIEEDNCLAKRSRMTRSLSYKYLTQLYALDPDVVLFRALRYFWSRDASGQSLLAFLCAFARDPLLRESAPLILGATRGVQIGREKMEAFLGKRFGSRFSIATLTSTAQNILASWVKSGHLSGVQTKKRVQAKATPGAVGYALLLGFLEGNRGPSLFETEYARLLDCPVPVAMELAAEASRRGWLVFKRVADIVEVVFPQQISAREKEWLREQA